MRPLHLLAAAVLAVLAPAAHAQDSPVLTTTVDDTVRSFTIEQLKQLPAQTITTETIWTEGSQTFEGVPLAALLDELGVESGVISAQAINDYAVDIPVDEITPTAPIIAYHQNGAPMARRDKGPLWLVYPYDSSPEYQTEMIYSRSIWQMDRLNLRR